MKPIYLISYCLFVVLSCARPIAKFESSKQVKLPTAVVFKNNAEKFDNLFWDFGDGSKSQDLNPSHHYSHSGSFTVQLKACKANICSQTTKKIQVMPPDHCYVRLETSFGSMLIRLYDETPQHRDNFTKLAEQGYFNDLLFHRVINGFMIQGGDPNSRNAKPGVALGMGGPDYTIPAEFNSALIHKKGALAAARTGDAMNPEKRSSGSQFYIVHGNPVSANMLERLEDQKAISYTDEQKSIYATSGGTPFLDRDYTVFGEIVEGLDVIDKIAAVATNPGDRPVEDVKMHMTVVK